MNVCFYLQNIDRFFLALLEHRIIPFISDEAFLKIKYRIMIKKKLNLENPQTFNEKLQWLKLHDRNPKYTKMVDKYAVKKYVAEKIGEQYLISTLGVWDSFENIDFDNLPNQFVLKCTHDSGGVVVCREKSLFDMQMAKQKLSKSLKVNYFWRTREWPYKNVAPRIIAEKYMEDSSDKDLVDYKLMCFNGKVKCSFVCEDRFSKTGLKVTFYDSDWKVMPFERHYPRNSVLCERPAKYDEMVALAEKLSENIPFVRVDFYEIGEKVYFGEMTFYPGSGFEEFYPAEWDIKLGEWLILPDIKNAK